MDKLKMETSDMAAENIEKIGALFPSAVTEMRGEDGSIKKGVNFEMLKQLLSPDVVEEDAAPGKGGQPQLGRHRKPVHRGR